MNDAINRNAPENILLFLDVIINTRKSDANMHQLLNRDVEHGHAYVYGLSKWLRYHYIPRQLPPMNQRQLTPQENEHWISVYTQEFINLYEMFGAQHPISAERAAIARDVANIWRNYVRTGGSKKRSRVRMRKSIRRKRAKRNMKKYRRTSKKHHKLGRK